MSFRLKTVLGIALIEIVLLSVLVFSGLRYIETSNERQFQERASTTARLLATMTTDAVIAMDLATLDALMQETLKNPDLLYVRIRARGGEILAQGGITASSAREEETIDDGTVKRIDSTHPITIAGSNFGSVEVGLSTAQLGATLSEAKRWLLGVALSEIVLVAIFGYLLGRILTAQLSSLQMGAKRVANGEIGFQIPAQGHDELADTAKSFNRMSQSLAGYAQSLEIAKEEAERGRAFAESTLDDAITNLSEGVLIVSSSGSLLHINNQFTALHEIDGAVDLQSSVCDVEMQLSARIENAVRGTATIEDFTEADGDGLAPPVGWLSLPEDRSRWTIRYKDGSTVIYNARHLTRGGHVIIAKDLSDIYRAEETARSAQREMMQSQKLEAIGTLSGGIAHELNTPIQFIGDNLSFIASTSEELLSLARQYEAFLDELEKNGCADPAIAKAREAASAADIDFVREEVPLAIEQSIDGVKQMAEIVGAMKEFSHPKLNEKSIVDVNHALERAAIIARSEWKDAATIAWELQPGTVNAYLNEAELNQILLNILVNAAHAIESAERGHGEIRIATRSTEKVVHISVSDNGIGIPKQNRDKVFEQFFTTKSVGKGTGQGLALCYDVVVNRNNGRLYFESKPGQGTTFHIELPKLPG